MKKISHIFPTEQNIYLSPNDKELIIFPPGNAFFPSLRVLYSWNDFGESLTPGQCHLSCPKKAPGGRKKGGKHPQKITQSCKM